jgi:DNA polymerase V
MQSVQVLNNNFLPIFLSTVKAGFPSPADDFVENKLDLNTFLIKHPAASFFVRVSGDSMINAGIFSGDILIVDRSLEAGDKSIVIAVVNSEFTVKRIRKVKQDIYLLPENKNYKPIKITDPDNFEVWGVVTYVIHNSMNN